MVSKRILPMIAFRLVVVAAVASLDRKSQAGSRCPLSLAADFRFGSDRQHLTFAPTKYFAAAAETPFNFNPAQPLERFVDADVIATHHPATTDAEQTITRSLALHDAARGCFVDCLLEFCFLDAIFCRLAENLIDEALVGGHVLGAQIV